MMKSGKIYGLISAAITIFLFTVSACAKPYYEDSCRLNLTHEIQSVLSGSPESYNSHQIDKLIKLTTCFNNLKLPFVTITLLTDARFKPVEEKLTTAQKMRIYKNIAKACHQNQNYAKAEAYYKKIINNYSNHANTDSLLSVSFELTDLLIEEDKTEKASLYLLLIHKITDTKPVEPGIRCRLLLQEAEVFRLKKQYNRAIALHLKATDSFKSCNPLLQLHHKLDLASLYIFTNNSNGAEKILNTVGSDSVLMIADYYLIKSSLFRLKKDFKNSAVYFKRFTSETDKQNRAIDHCRQKMLVGNAGFGNLLATIKPVKKHNFFSWGLLLSGITLSIIVLTILVLIIISQRKQLKRRREELLKAENTKLKLLEEGRKLTLKEEGGVKKRVELIKKETKEKNLSIQKLKQQIENAGQTKKKMDKVNLEINFQVRSLLSSVIGLAGIFKTEFAKAKNKPLYQYTDIIEENATLLLNIIDAYHEYTSIDSGKIACDIKKVNAVSIIQNTVNEWEKTAREKAAKLVFNSKKIPLVLADDSILKKIITIAIGVALNNTNRGFIIIDIDLTKESDYCIIKIQNTGHGFDAAFITDILEPFNREGLNYIPGFTGTGMEYPLINRLAKLMNGKVSVSSAIEQGITFTLTLPATGEYEATPAEMRAEKKPGEGKSDIPWKGLKVLVVEDDVMNRLLFSKILKSASTLVIAENGEKALETVGDFFREDEVFDLVLMDINLPQPWDGVKLKDKIKELFLPYKTVPFIAQTAYAMQGDREEFLAKGFDEYISKPIMKHELIRVSAIALKQKATS